MPIINCKKCGAQISTEFGFRPKCGKKIINITIRGCLVSIAAMIGSLILILIMLSMILPKSEQRDPGNSVVRSDIDSLPVEKFKYHDSLPLDSLRWYFQESSRSLKKSSDHKILIHAFSIQELKVINVKLDEILGNSAEIEFPDNTFDSLISICNRDSLKVKKSIDVALAKIKKVKRITQVRQKADDEKKAAAIVKLAETMRIKFATDLREQYLDNNMDIKVVTSGPGNKIITLKYVLFNDVWAHKIQKGDLISKIQGIGFKKLTMTNGYDWTVHWNFKNEYK